MNAQLLDVDYDSDDTKSEKKQGSDHYLIDDDYAAKVLRNRRQSEYSQQQRPMMMLVEAALNDVDYIAKRLKKQSGKKKVGFFKYILLSNIA